MKVGDKVYIELKVIDITSHYFKTNKGWHNNDEAAQLPIQEGRWMMVSDDNKVWQRRFVTHMQCGMFASPGSVAAFSKYAKEIPTKRKLTMQEIAEKFNEDVDNIEICTE